MSQIPPAEQPTFPAPQVADRPPMNLQYSTPSQVGQRPGVLTAVAIISIVLGSMGVLSNGMGVISGFVQLAMARTPPGTWGTTTTLVTPTTVSTTGPATAPAAAPAGGAVTTPVFTPMVFTRKIAVLTIGEAVLSLALAGFLLTCGVLVIRNSPRGRKWHVAYAWVKIPVAILGAVSGWIVSNEFLSNMASAGPGMNPPPLGSEVMRGVMIASAAMSLLITCIYPVALLIVMKTRKVREFYNFLGGPA